MKAAAAAFLFLLACASHARSERTARCGDPGRYAIIVIEVKDTAKAAMKAESILSRDGATTLAPECRFSRSFGSVPPGTKSTLLVRWLPHAQINVLQRDIMELGTLFHFDVKTEGTSAMWPEAAKYRALKEERDAGGVALGRLPWTRALIDAELARLAPAESLVNEVGDKLLLNVQLLEKDGDRSQSDPPKPLLAACRKNRLHCENGIGDILSQLFKMAATPSRAEIVGVFRGIAYNESSSMPLTPALLIIQHESADRSAAAPLRVTLLAGSGVPREPPFGPYIDSFMTRRSTFDPVELRPDEAYFQREVLGMQGTNQIALMEKYHMRRLDKDSFVVLQDGWGTQKYFFYGTAPR